MPDKETNSKKKEYQERAAKVIERRQMAEPVQLKLWPAEMRGAPNSVLRSALFGVVERGKREYVEKKLLASWPGLEIRYTGMELDQGELDVWLQAVHQARECLGDRVVLNERKFLRALGRSEGGKDMKWLHLSLNRMQACGVSLDIGDYEYQGSLIQEFARDKRTGKWVLELNPRLKSLFDDGLTLLSLEQRKQLKGSLAKWLQGYICSHRATPKAPHRIGLEKLRELCGSDASRLRKFREVLRRAMSELQDAGIVVSWQLISGEKVLEFVRPMRRRKSKQLLR